ncbi:MAG: serine O-acetyltransferase [Alphaproteobacteria bacterium]|nr:MAG: serine O-acetyltransferase [Alphaproteobacteria bacterium]
MFDNIRHDIAVVLERDPAAKSKFDALISYPGVHALIYYRIAHWAWENGFYTLGRFISHMGRFLTGIEIHPGAKIGKGVFFDHGMGIVIGETAEVGDNVTLYQGVTLGGTSLEGGKRHPTLESGVIVGAGAKIIGPILVGRNARVGSNAVVVKPVLENTTVIGIPAKVVQPPKNKNQKDFCAYGLSTDDLPDPIARSLEGIFDMVCSLKGRVEELEQELAEREARDIVKSRKSKKTSSKMAKSETTP